ncbi:MAG: PIG-L deacetylase family protein [Anaerolineales bacterium]
MPTNQRRMLVSFAHPDDESFGPGGTLAHYALQGVQIDLICATNGDVGTVDPELMRDFQSVAALRQAELDCAAQALGLNEIFLLGYRDSGMPGSPDNKHEEALAAAPLEEVVEQVTHYIRKVRPQVVLTFDPIGGYFHPDHVRMHDATVEAFHAAGDSDQYPGDLPPYQPQKLYFFTINKRWMKLLVRLMPLLGMDPTKWGRNDDIDLTALIDHDIPIHASIDTSEGMEAKELAAACHASQADEDGSPGFLLNWIRRLSMQRDHFSRGYPPADDNLKEKDLFSGIDLDEPQ